MVSPTPRTYVAAVMVHNDVYMTVETISDAYYSLYHKYNCNTIVQL